MAVGGPANGTGKVRVSSVPTNTDPDAFDVVRPVFDSTQQIIVPSGNFIALPLLLLTRSGVCLTHSVGLGSQLALALANTVPSMMLVTV